MPKTFVGRLAVSACCVSVVVAAAVAAPGGSSEARQSNGCESTFEGDVGVQTTARRRPMSAEVSDTTTQALIEVEVTITGSQFDIARSTGFAALKDAKWCFTAGSEVVYGNGLWGTNIVANRGGKTADIRNVMLYSVTAETLGDQRALLRPSGVMGMAFDGQYLWTAGASEVSKLDLASNTVVATIPNLENQRPIRVAFDGVHIWVTSWNANHPTTQPGYLSKIDPLNNVVISSFEVGPNPSGLAFGAGSVWVANHGSDAGNSRVWRFNPADGSAVQYDFGSRVHDVAFDGTDIWVTLQGGVAKLDLSQNPAVIVPVTGVFSNESRITFGAGSIWVTNRIAHTVARIDPESNEVVSVIQLANLTEPQGITFGAGSIWVANRTANKGVTKIDPSSNNLEYISLVAPNTSFDVIDIAFGGNGIWLSGGQGSPLKIVVL
jgi:streptogramin lyase